MQVVLWPALRALITPHYRKIGPPGRQPYVCDTRRASGVEHQFRVLKPWFVCSELCHRGLVKNAVQVLTLVALSNRDRTLAAGADHGAVAPAEHETLKRCKQRKAAQYRHWRDRRACVMDSAASYKVFMPPLGDGHDGH